MLDTTTGAADFLQDFWAAEHSALVALGAPAELAKLAAARTAALAAIGDFPVASLPEWVPLMAREVAPSLAELARIWPAAAAADLTVLNHLWGRLGTAESIMETGGDIRLARDPVTALNGYGCSHRPRPWAVTFASSTASSSSERGYAAADAARRRVTAKLLAGQGRAAVADELVAVRSALKGIYGAEVALAASGTDTELLALALTHLAEPAPITNILVAPEETGSGVPMAAGGLHFAVDTALGHDVARAAPIEGFRGDTVVCEIPLRGPGDAVRPEPEVAAAVETALADGLQARRRVILHVLDLSKTGLLAPGMDILRRLRARHGAAFDIVVDACQARLSPDSVRAYLALEAVVLVTGSKFFTGPPFAGAVLMPPTVAARLKGRALPAGLAAYFGRDELPDCAAATGLPPVGNYGLALRWQAALAEIGALFDVPPPRRAEILDGFAAVVREELSRNPALTLLPAPPIDRGAEDWERRRTIFGFSMRYAGRCLNADEARLVYRWLNADLAGALPGLAPGQARLARRICHIGQPVKLPAAGGFMGVLRVSAGARLISGEPSHQAFGDQARLQREFSDLRDVFGKIALILENFERLAAADPVACYRA